MLTNKRGAVSFGTIVAVFGSILIALGIAWLIAQNWHQMPSALKIIILLAATSGAYVAGTILRIKNYPGIGKALFVLGALLYTLSIFLIAQIFSTSVSAQGIAWLLLLAWAGVFASAYIFDSSASLIVALIEFMVWLAVQFVAFIELSRQDTSFGVLALYFLATGILVYGLGLLHRSAGHKFGRVYQFWTAFYFLAFAYTLSFQSLLPILWSEELAFSAAVVFLVFLGALALIMLFSGIIASVKNNAVQNKEVIGIFALIVFLAALIASTSFVSGSTGICYLKSCYDLKDKASCENQELGLKCRWDNNNCAEFDCYQYQDESLCTQSKCKWIASSQCQERNCGNYKDEASCNAAPTDLLCQWAGTYCIGTSCSYYSDKNSCENAPSGMNCEWANEACKTKSCGDYNVRDACENSPASLDCVWRDYSNSCESAPPSCYAFLTKNSCLKAQCDWASNGRCGSPNEFSGADDQKCYSLGDKTACENMEGCMWIRSYCEVERPCEKYFNDKESCQQHNECQWRQGYSYWGRNEKIPLVLWGMWIFANIIFILLILGIIGYGTWQKLPKIINLGIIFFALDIISRYIGFVMDFWGYTSLSIIFIIGGIALLAGGWFVEKWRRNLVSLAKSERPATQNKYSSARK